MKFLEYYINKTRFDLDNEGNKIETVITKKIRVKDNAEGRALAASEAIGEIKEFDDGKGEPKPTQLDIIEAQVAYMAMMTGLLEV